MRSSGPWRRRPPSGGCGFLLGLLLVLGLPGVFGCATRAPAEDPASERARPIDLSPRCIVFEPLSERVASLPESARSRRIAPTLEAAVLPAPGAGQGSEPTGALQRLRWVTPVSAFRSPTDARAAFFVWSLGELSADPGDFRRRLRARGLALSTARLGDRVVLDLVFPARELDAALEGLRTLMSPEAIVPDRLESIRLELALLLLAEESAPKTAARRLRHSLRAGEPAPGATSVLDTLDGESLRDALLVALHGDSDGIEAGHLLVYSGAEPAPVADNNERQSEMFEAALDRLEEAAASWAGPWGSTAPTGDATADADVATRDRSAPETGQTEAREPTAGTTPVIHLLDAPGARQVELLASMATVGRGATDRPALEMLASLLGDPLGGRLFRDLRERQGLAYEIGAEQTAAGHFEVSTRTRPERLGALMLGIEAHQAALAREPIQDCELAVLRERMHGLLALEADEPGARLDGLVRAWDGPGSSPGLASRAAAYQADSRETLERVARRWLAGPPEWLLVGDADQVVDRLREAFPDRRVVVYDASLEIVREVGGP